MLFFHTWVEGFSLGVFVSQNFKLKMMIKPKVVLFLFFSFFISEKSIAQDQFKLLVYTIHDDWHSNSIPVAIEAFQKLAKKHQFKFDWTQRPNELIKKLPNYDVVVFVNANADSLKENHIEGLKKFMKRGGGFVGVHSTSAGKIRKPWFDNLIGGVFVDHPKLQAAIVKVEDKNFPAVFHLPQKMLWSDEWYNFKNININKLNVVLSVDETSYDFTAGYDKIPLKGMGKLHPVAWSHTYQGGRVFYTSLGHKPEVFKDEIYMKHLLGGIYWVLKK